MKTTTPQSPPWPETVPVLSAEDMCIGPIRDGNCGCLVRHALWTFDFNESIYGDAIKALNTESRSLDAVGEMGNFVTFPRDVGRISETTAARVWNRAMAILGYVVNNPECTRTGKLKPVKAGGAK